MYVESNGCDMRSVHSPTVNSFEHVRNQAHGSTSVSSMTQIRIIKES